jgi:hypothetical protein
MTDLWLLATTCKLKIIKYVRRSKESLLSMQREPVTVLRTFFGQPEYSSENCKENPCYLVQAQFNDNSNTQNY